MDERELERLLMQGQAQQEQETYYIPPVRRFNVVRFAPGSPAEGPAVLETLQVDAHGYQVGEHGELNFQSIRPTRLPNGKELPMGYSTRTIREWEDIEEDLTFIPPSTGTTVSPSKLTLN